MKDDFYYSIKDTFKDKADSLIKLLDEPYLKSFFINSSKLSKDKVLKLLDFKYNPCSFNDNAFYYEFDNISKTKAYELGLIYPQGVESSLSSCFLDIEPKIIVDLCAAPGGKSINFQNKFKDAICISNDINLNRVKELAKNFERLGLSNNIITCKKPNELSKLLQGKADIVIVDAPCSGEGIVRKYKEVINEYSLNNVNKLSLIQKELLEDAYNIVKKDGYIVYSTCTYNLSEDENNVISFLNKHSDLSLYNIDCLYNYSSLKGTIKLCPLNNSEGQFISIIKRNSVNQESKIKYLKETNNNIVKQFIKDNLNIDNYCLYSINDRYYLSFNELFDLKDNVLRYGVYLGDLDNNVFKPNHNLFRSNLLANKFKYTYDLNDDEYNMFIKGFEIKKKLDNNYYQVTYKGLSLGFVKSVNGVLKNKYPKGLRRL